MRMTSEWCSIRPVRHSVRQTSFELVQTVPPHLATSSTMSQQPVVIMSTFTASSIHPVRSTDEMRLKKTRLRSVKLVGRLRRVTSPLPRSVQLPLAAPHPYSQLTRSERCQQTVADVIRTCLGEFYTTSSPTSRADPTRLFRTPRHAQDDLGP